MKSAKKKITQVTIGAKRMLSAETGPSNKSPILNWNAVMPLLYNNTHNMLPLHSAVCIGYF